MIYPYPDLDIHLNFRCRLFKEVYLVNKLLFFGDLVNCLRWMGGLVNIEVERLRGKWYSLKKLLSLIKKVLNFFNIKQIQNFKFQTAGVVGTIVLGFIYVFSLYLKVIGIVS